MSEHATDRSRPTDLERGGTSTLGVGGRAFAIVSGLAALVVVLATIGPWVYLQEHPGGPTADIRPWFDAIHVGIPVAAGAILVIGAVLLFAQSTGSLRMRLLLAVSIAALGIALAVFSLVVGDHLMWVVPAELEGQIPFCGVRPVSPSSPCITADPSEALVVVFWSGAAIGLFGVAAATRHQSSETSRWSDAKILGVMLLTVAALLIALLVLGLWFVSQVGH